MFIPDDIWVSVEVPYDEWPNRLKETLGPDGRLTEPKKVTRSADPDEWQRWVESDEALTTRFKEEGWPSSSSSAPWVMARMIGALDLKPGMRVLEIGTGTGFNAACLSALGATVTSIEFQADVAEHARDNLAKAGYDVRVVTGDGVLGAPDGAPFDRLIATAAVHTIPYAWVEQVKEGGRLVVPYTGQFHHGALLILTVADGIASGGMADRAAFMPLTGQGLSQQELKAIEDRSGLRITVGPDGQTICPR